MKATIKEIVKSEPDAWQGLTKTTFYANEHEQQAYIFSKPENVPAVGDILEGEFSQDRGANWKFKRAQVAPGQQGGSYKPSAPQERVFKGDPDTRDSIEWQCCLKAAVEAVRDYHSLYGDGRTPEVTKAQMPFSLADYKRDIVNAVVTFTQTIGHKPDRPVEAPHEDELPPVEDLVPEADDLNVEPF